MINWFNSGSNLIFKLLQNTNNMSSLQFLNTKADLLRRSQALAVNINAAKGLQEVLKTNLGPKGTMKM